MKLQYEVIICKVNYRGKRCFIELTKEDLKQKRKRKVAKQIISFDDDEPLSLPSSSSSVGSDELSVKVEARQKMSLERSGSFNDKFGAANGKLTPADHISIGELTPISVEKEEAGMESPDTSENIIEVSSWNYLKNQQ